jgi:hypothetical protein
MASTLDLYIDTSTGALLDGGSVAGGSLPTLTRNDSYTLRLRLMEKGASGALTDINTSGASLKVGIGNIEDLPADGEFKLVCNGTTSSPIQYNATAVSVYTAISNNVSTVSLYGPGSYGSYLLTATQPNTAMSFSTDSFTLFPASSVIVSSRRNPTTGVYAQQVIKLVRDPIVFSDTFTDATTAGQIVLSKISGGGVGQNETYDLSFGQQVVGGLYSLNWGGTSTTGIPPFASAITVQSSISAGINTITSNISVDDNGKGGYTIQFTGRLAQTNITTPLLLDASGVNFIPLKQTTLTINTSGVEDAFASSGEDTITPTIEVEITQNGTPKTVYQGSVTIRKDLITSGAAVPAPQSSYYTKAEIDSLFVADNSQYLEVSNRKLLNSEGDTFINWGSGQISDSTSTCIGFFGATPVTRPNDVPLLNAISSLGLIGSGVSIGVLTFPALDPSNSTTLQITATAVSFSSTTGLIFGTTTSQRLGFFNTTPTAQPASTNIVSAMVGLGLVASSVTIGSLSGVVTNWTLNVDATNRKLVSGNIQVDYANALLIDSSGAQAINWGGRALKINSSATALDWSFSGVTAYYDLGITDSKNVVLGTSSGTKIGTATAQKIGFWNSTPVTQPNQPNVVTALRGCGLLAGGPSVTTYGIFPLSSRTLTTTASIYFGEVPNNATNSVSVVVTGCQLNDIVLLGLPAGSPQGVSFLGHVTTTDGLEVDCINATNGNITPATATYRITVIGY